MWSEAARRSEAAGGGGRAGDLRRFKAASMDGAGGVEDGREWGGGGAGRAEAACRALLLYFWKAGDGGWKEERLGFDLAPPW
jgi:hypothetical protein